MTPVENALLKFTEHLLFAARAAHAQLDACEKTLSVLSEKYVKPENQQEAKEFVNESLAALRQASFLHDLSHETYRKLLGTYAQMIPDDAETGKEVQAALEGLDSVTSRSVVRWLTSLDSAV